MRLRIRGGDDASGFELVNVLLEISDAIERDCAVACSRRGGHEDHAETDHTPERAVAEVDVIHPRRSTEPAEHEAVSGNARPKALSEIHVLGFFSGHKIVLHNTDRATSILG